MPQRRPSTLTTGRGLAERGREGRISGYVFKLMRESTALTQEQLAERLNMDVTTVQGWESGRRPLMAVPVGSYLALKHTLLGLPVAPRLLSQLDLAMEADRFLGYILSTDRAEPTGHPLASWVITRSFTDLLAWPFTKQTPAVLTQVISPRARRGPVPSGPTLTADETHHVFTHLKVITELADVTQVDGMLLRRQAHYVSGFDDSSETADWLAVMQRTEERRIRHTAEWTPEWAVVRSGAHTLARFGDRDALAHFIRGSIGSDQCEVANLNYWAYWLGELAEPQIADTFMIEPHTWHGTRLLDHLIAKLDAANPYIDVVAHTLWSLLTSRPALLPHAVDQLTPPLTRTLDSDGISDQSRRELQEVFYALRMSQRR